MARNLGTALSGLSKPGKAVPVKKGTASMTIEPMPPKVAPSIPKKFTDKNTDTRYLPQDIPAKGGSISPNPNPSAASAKARVRDTSTT